MPDRHQVMTPTTPLGGIPGDDGTMPPIPPLVEGDWLDQPTFHARYEAMPPGTRAELINGVVYMPSPVGRPHSREHMATSAWLNDYLANTSGVEGLENVFTPLGLKSEPQPDLMLRVLPKCGGRTRDEGGIIAGIPELLVEISHASRYTDLGPKLEDYERVGVQEYVVRALEPDAVHWLVLRNGRFAVLPPGPDGIFRSEVFPGLWLDPQALLRSDRRRLRAVVDLGCATPSTRNLSPGWRPDEDQAKGTGPA